MEKNERILAVGIDSKLFDKIDEIVDQDKISKKKYVTDLITKDISIRMQQKAEQEKELNIKHTESVKTWDRAEVMDAIDDFILQNRRIPKQTEFKNENGLPSYGAAGRALERSPAEYMRERCDELLAGLEQEGSGMEMGM